MWERGKLRPWLFGLVALAVIVLVVARNRQSERREPGELDLATIDIEGKTVEVTAAIPGVTVAPPKERQEVVAHAGGVGALADADELLVEVVSPDGTPVAGARVAYLDVERAGLPREADRSGDPDGAFAQALVREADAAGRVRFPTPDTPTRLAGWHGEAYGERTLAVREPGPVRLALVPDPPVRVRVVDLAGAPVAGVPVVLRTANDILNRRRTGSDGWVELPLRGRRRVLPDPGAFVQLGILAADLEVVRVVRPVEPLELVLPEVGSVELELVDGGTRFLGNGDVQLYLTEAEEARQPTARFAYELHAPFEQGRARFEFVGLGLEHVVAVHTDERQESGLEFRGPARNGEVRRLRVEVGAQVPVLAGRLLEESGVPLSGVTARLTLREEWSSRQVGVRTGPEGDFRQGIVDTEGFETIQVEVLAPSNRLHDGHFPLPRLVAGLNDLGDLNLTPTPLLMAGRVVDAEGRPVPGVQVDFFNGFEPERPLSGEKLPVEATSDAFGEFELHRRIDAEFVGVRAEHRRFTWGTENVRVGTSDLEIVLVSTGSLSLECRFDGLRMPMLFLRRGGERLGTSAMSVHGGRITFQKLSPGSYTLEWVMPFSDTTGFVDGLVVVGGEETRDARLEPLDLRGRVPSLKLRVSDAVGAPVTGFTLELDRGAGFELYARDVPSPEVSVVAGPWPMRARMTADGFRPWELAALAGDREVVLTSGPGVVFEPSGALPLLPREWAWCLWVRPEDRQRFPLGAPVFLAPRGEARVATEGPYQALIGAVRRVGSQLGDNAYSDFEFPFEVRGEGTRLFLPPFEDPFVQEILDQIAASDPFSPR